MARRTSTWIVARGTVDGIRTNTPFAQYFKARDLVYRTPEIRRRTGVEKTKFDATPHQNLHPEDRCVSMVGGESLQALNVIRLAGAMTGLAWIAIWIIAPLLQFSARPGLKTGQEQARICESRTLNSDPRIPVADL